MSEKLTQALIKKLEKRLSEDIVVIKEQIGKLKERDPFSDPDRLSDNAAIDTDAREQIGHDTIEAEIKELNRRLKDITLALQKIKKGIYGICERCGKQIPIARLKLMSEARRCIECEKSR